MRHFFQTMFSVAVIAMAVSIPCRAEGLADPATAAPGVYELDPRHTSVIWKVSHLGFSYFVGRFDTASGQLDYNPANPVKSTVKVTIDPLSLYTNVPDFAKELTGPDWLNAAKGPITFVSTEATLTGGTAGTVSGDLTLNGVTRKVTFEVGFIGAGHNDFAQAEAIGFSGKTTIKRSDFGITKLIPAVGDEVLIEFESEFLQKAQPVSNQ